MNFTPGLKPRMENCRAYWLIFQNNDLLIETEKQISIPLLDYERVSGKLDSNLYLGEIDGVPAYAGVVSPEQTIENLKPQGLRQLFGKLDEPIFQLAGRSVHVVNWDRESRYCGFCGAATVWAQDQFAKSCPECGRLVFPRISPAVIVAIVRNDQLLLARSTRFPSGFYSVIAGFVEPGETLEACVRREVREEVGIEVRNIRYFGSQPWPFPDSLMIAYTAEYAGGEIVIDEKEIAAAGWFRAGEMPRVPERLSIARQLIDWFLEKGKP